MLDVTMTTKTSKFLGIFETLTPLNHEQNNRTTP